MIPLDEVVHFDSVTHSPTTGAVTDADSPPTFDVFEEATDTPILAAQTMTKRTVLTGNYRGTFTTSAANGFEAGKWYNVVTIGTVGGVTGKAVAMTFRIAPAETVAGVPKVDPSHLAGQTITAAAGVTFPSSVASLTADQVFSAAFKAKVVVHVNGATGNDTTGDGTFALPWATIGKANGDAPTPAVILVYPGTYAESTEVAMGRELWLMRGAIVAPAAGNPFWCDSSYTSIRGDGVLQPPAATAAVLVTDGVPDIRGITMELIASGSFAVNQTSSAPVILSDIKIIGSVNAPDDPADFFTTDSADFTRFAMFDVAFQYTDAGSTKNLLIGDGGYPGNLVQTNGIASAVWANPARVITDGTISALAANTITATSIADDAITDAKIAVPAETAGRPTRVLAMLRRSWEWIANKRIRTRATGVVQLRNAADGGNLETATQSTAGGVGAEVDQQTAGS